MRPKVTISTEEEPDWFVKPGDKPRIRIRTFAIIYTPLYMLYKTLMYTHYKSEHWNSWKINEHGLFITTGQQACGLRINFELPVSVTRATEIIDTLHNFAEAYLQEAEEYNNGTHTIQEEAKA